MCLQWSREMDTVYKEHIVDPVVLDSRTDFEKSLWMGFPFDFIRKQVICQGLADFDNGFVHDEYGELSADDKVLLYCFCNMRQHFFEALATFRAFKTRLSAIASPGQRLIMVDLGCGPGTAALAFAEAFDSPRMDYLGLDRSKPMLKKAKSLLEAARACSLFDQKSQFDTTSSWAVLSDFPAKLIKAASVLINATYLFASNTLDVADVSHAVEAFRRQTAVQNLLFCYSNTKKGSAQTRFETFKNGLPGIVASTGTVSDEVEFRKKRNGVEKCRVEFCRELLVLKHG